MGEGRLHSTGEGLVVRASQQRVEPDDSPAAPAKARHLTREQRRVAAVPAVGHDQQDRPIAHHTSSPPSVERVQRLAGARPAAPIRDIAQDLRQWRARPRETPRDSRQLGREHERLDMPGVRRQTGDEVKQDRLYRSIDPLTSPMTTMGRGAWRRRRNMRLTSSPRIRLCRSNGRRSMALPVARCQRLVRRRPRRHGSRVNSRRAASISAVVKSANPSFSTRLRRCQALVARGVSVLPVRADLLELDMNWNPWRRSNDDARPFAQRKQWQAGTGFVTCAEEKVESGIEAAGWNRHDAGPEAISA